MLEKLFKSRTTARVLSLLLFGEPLHVREIARRTGITPAYVGKELASLASLGIASETKVGNLRVWEADRSSPIYQDLKGLFLKTDYVGGSLRESLTGKKIDFALIFGSFARGTETGKSDVDLLVVGGIPEDELLSVVDGAEKEAGREINYILWRKKDFEKRAKAGDRFLGEVARNPLIWLLGDENGFRQAVKGRLR